jgi:signal transduction histidine kinase/ActR/RegA family two-component response regulator
MAPRVDDTEEKQLRSAALQNVQSILQARQRAEQELISTKETLEEERRILELLNETGKIVASKLDLQSVVQAVTDAGTQLSGAQFGAFFYTVSNAEGDVFTLYTLSGAPREAFEKFGHPRSTPVFAPTFRGEPVIRVGDIRKDPRYGHWAPHYGMPPGHLPVRSYLAVSVIARTGEVIGGLFFGHSDCDVFTERSERLILGIAAQAAIAIDNARLYEQAKHAAQERSQVLAAERAARAESERISLIKVVFLATLSHELRTPLNAVLGWAHILLSKSSEESESRRGLEAIARNARAQAKLVDDLLDMNGIVSGKVRLDVQPMELSSVVEAALDSMRPSAEAKGIVVRKTIDPNATVFGDRNRLQQVVWNLLTNAVKFTPKGGKIDVIVERVNSHVEITVHDSGVGISEDFLPHLFERFRQADSSTTRKFGGLGLGLSIVKQLIELHGGSVKAESAGEGRGSTFIVSLPLRAVRPSSPSPREHPSTEVHSSARLPAISLQGLKVLVIDDEADARELVQSVLADAGAETFVAASAQEGFRVLQVVRPDVIISDIGMPERDGYQFIKDVRGLHASQGGRTPAVALTAFARSEDRTRAMLAGYQVHISKPIEPEELVATIKSQAGHPT